MFGVFLCSCLCVCACVLFLFFHMMFSGSCFFLLTGLITIFDTDLKRNLILENKG